MDWLQILTVIGANFGLFLWCRSESREDHRQLEAATTAQLNGIRYDMKEFRDLWMQESKDFHKRLCEIEAARKS